MSLDIDAENAASVPAFNDYEKPLSERLLSAFKSQLRTDCTFVVGEKYDPEGDSIEIPNNDENPIDFKSSANETLTDTGNDSYGNIVEIRCNRLLLCIVSPVLNAMLNTSVMKESKLNSTVNLPEDSPLGFELLVRYSYSDQIKVCCVFFAIYFFILCFFCFSSECILLVTNISYVQILCLLAVDNKECVSSITGLFTVSFHVFFRLF